MCVCVCVGLWGCGSVFFWAAQRFARYKPNSCVFSTGSFRGRAEMKPFTAISTGGGHWKRALRQICDNFVHPPCDVRKELPASLCKFDAKFATTLHNPDARRKRPLLGTSDFMGFPPIPARFSENFFQNRFAHDLGRDAVPRVAPKIWPNSKSLSDNDILTPIVFGRGGGSRLLRGPI